MNFDTLQKYRHNKAKLVKDMWCQKSVIINGKEDIISEHKNVFVYKLERAVGEYNSKTFTTCTWKISDDDKIVIDVEKDIPISELTNYKMIDDLINECIFNFKYNEKKLLIKQRKEEIENNFRELTL